MNEATLKIDEYLNGLPQWQKDNLAAFRTVIHECDSSVVEDWNWNVPVFIVNGKMLFAMSAFKAHTKYNFIGNGALLEDKDKLFNNGFESKKSRGIDLKEHEAVDKNKLRELILEAIRL